MDRGRESLFVTQKVVVNLWRVVKKERQRGKSDVEAPCRPLVPPPLDLSLLTLLFGAGVGIGIGRGVVLSYGTTVRDVHRGRRGLAERPGRQSSRSGTAAWRARIDSATVVLRYGRPHTPPRARLFGPSLASRCTLFAVVPANRRVFVLPFLTLRQTYLNDFCA